MASEPRLDEASTAAAAARRFWRLVSIASLTIFLIGTHWPKLRLPEVEGGPASDKLIHFIAFALLAVPVWWTGWFSRLRTLTIAGALFAIFPESVYRGTRNGRVAVAPPGTVYSIGMPGVLHTQPIAPPQPTFAPGQFEFDPVVAVVRISETEPA